MLFEYSLFYTLLPNTWENTTGIKTYGIGFDFMKRHLLSIYESGYFMRDLILETNFKENKLIIPKKKMILMLLKIGR